MNSNREHHNRFEQASAQSVSHPRRIIEMESNLSPEEFERYEKVRQFVADSERIYFYAYHLLNDITIFEHSGSIGE